MKFDWKDAVATTLAVLAAVDEWMLDSGPGRDLAAQWHLSTGILALAALIFAKLAHGLPAPAAKEPVPAQMGDQQ